MSVDYGSSLDAFIRTAQPGINAQTQQVQAMPQQIQQFMQMLQQQQQLKAQQQHQKDSLALQTRQQDSTESQNQFTNKYHQGLLENTLSQRKETEFKDKAKALNDMDDDFTKNFGISGQGTPQEYEKYKVRYAALGVTPEEFAKRVKPIMEGGTMNEPDMGPHPENIQLAEDGSPIREEPKPTGFYEPASGAMQTLAAATELNRKTKVEEERKANSGEGLSDIGKISRELKQGIITPQQARDRERAINHRAQSNTYISNTPAMSKELRETTLKGPEALALVPENIRGLVRGIVTGADLMPSMAGRHYAEAQKIREYVYKVDPGWDKDRAAIRKSFATSKEGINIRSLNTATVHLGELLEAAEDLHNGTFTPGNEAYNKISKWLGHPAPTTYEQFRQIVAGEQANAMKGNATDVEIGHVLANISNADSPAQALAGGRAGMKAMSQKLNTAAEAYHARIPGGYDKHWSPVLPSAQRLFDKYDIGGGGEAAPAKDSHKGKTLPNGSHKDRTLTRADFDDLEPELQKLFLDGGGTVK